MFVGTVPGHPEPRVFLANAWPAGPAEETTGVGRALPLPTVFEFPQERPLHPPRDSSFSLSVWRSVNGVEPRAP